MWSIALTASVLRTNCTNPQCFPAGIRTCMEDSLVSNETRAGESNATHIVDLAELGEQSPESVLSDQGAQPTNEYSGVVRIHLRLFEIKPDSRDAAGLLPFLVPSSPADVAIGRLQGAGSVSMCTGNTRCGGWKQRLRGGKSNAHWQSRISMCSGASRARLTRTRQAVHPLHLDQRTLLISLFGESDEPESATDPRFRIDHHFGTLAARERPHESRRSIDAETESWILKYLCETISSSAVPISKTVILPQAIFALRLLRRHVPRNLRPRRPGTTTHSDRSLAVTVLGIQSLD
ncbi:unnamed protein product [Mycena citricolor]|uniref:Uncharacterized protein n=1 Tax=Mycena citricolor TaxID=2018698 RepID=A0AAD2HGN8_9AGAR|nr:unnamed protein product [Mycena citricolor]